MTRLPERLRTETGLIEWKIDRVVPDFESLSRFTSEKMLRKFWVETSRFNRVRVARGL